MVKLGIIELYTRLVSKQISMNKIALTLVSLGLNVTVCQAGTNQNIFTNNLAPYYTNPSGLNLANFNNRTVYGASRFSNLVLSLNNLSDDQRKEIQKIYNESLRKLNQPINDEINKLRKTEDELKNQDNDALINPVDQIRKQINSLHEKMKANNQEADLKVYSILSNEQNQSILKMHEGTYVPPVVPFDLSNKPNK